MIRLIIVDDEKTTRNSLMELVPWDDFGIDAIMSAKNGIDALEIAESFTPSIILCDVRMPKMDGIELSIKIRQLYLDCEIIFLSGFSDKDYLKTAIKINAVDYLEKPIDIEELKAVFQKTIQKIHQRKEKAIEEEKLKSSISHNIHLIRQEILMELISGKAEPLNLKSKYDSDVFRLYDEGTFTAVSVFFDWFSRNLADDISLTKISILKILNNEDFFYKRRFLSGFVDDNHLVLVMNNDICFSQTELKPFLNGLFDLLQSHSAGSFTFSIGLSPSNYEINTLSEAYKASMETLRQQFYKGVNQIFYPLDKIQSNYEINVTVYSKFKKLLRSYSVAEAITVVNDLTEEICKTNDPDIVKIKNIYFNFLNILLEVTIQWGTLEAVDDIESKYIWQEVDSQITLNGLSDFLITCIKTVFNNSIDIETSLNKINEIIKYIIDHYTDNQLSIQSIAEYAALSQTYLCAFFKKSTGKTLNEYITELRIEKAKELLEGNRLKLYEVVTHIGFTDVNYFSVLFKKNVGLTPTDFKEKKLHGKKTI